MRHEYSFLAWHNVIKNILLIPLTLYQLSKLILCECPECDTWIEISRILVSIFSTTALLHQLVYYMATYCHK